VYKNGVAAPDSPNLRAPAVLQQPYLMVVQQIPFYRDSSGRLFVGEMWHKDLGMHLEHLKSLMVAAPILTQQPPADAIALDRDVRMSRLEVVELPDPRSFLESIKVMPTLVSRLWRAARRADTVHSAVAGWPIPMGWIVTPIVLMLRKRYVIVVESAPWRHQEGLALSWKVRLRSSLQELISRWIVRRADLSVFTHDGYRQSMLGKNAAKGHVIPASWIDERDILSEENARGIWAKKLADTERLRVLFAGRLLPDKGLLVLLDAMRQLSARGEPITLDVLGEGPLKQNAEDLSKHLANGPTRVGILGTVAYGAPLLALLRTYDAVIVPSISDEQPRIVFDAYSQAVPILASNTPGLRSCVRDGETGLLTKPNDARALAETLHQGNLERTRLFHMGLRSLQDAHRMTHQEMHRKRAELLSAMDVK
jgi:glycosyltransferase involved in cell wall biosynthesis